MERDISGNANACADRRVAYTELGARMGQSELFSYLSAFVTIVLAVALGNMIQSTHQLIRARHRVKWDALPLLFAAIIAVLVVSEFFSLAVVRGELGRALWSGLAISQVSMARLLWMLAVPTMFALLAYSVLPDEIPAGGIDLTAFYFSERRVWAAIFALASLLDMARSIELFVSHGMPVTSYIAAVWASEVVVYAGLAIMFFSSSRRWNWLGVLIIAGAVIYGTMDATIRSNGSA